MQSYSGRTVSPWRLALGEMLLQQSQPAYAHSPSALGHPHHVHRHGKAADGIHNLHHHQFVQIEQVLHSTGRSRVLLVSDGSSAHYGAHSNQKYVVKIVSSSSPSSRAGPASHHHHGRSLKVAHTCAVALPPSTRACAAHPQQQQQSHLGVPPASLDGGLCQGSHGAAEHGTVLSSVRIPSSDGTVLCKRRERIHSDMITTSCSMQHLQQYGSSQLMGLLAAADEMAVLPDHHPELVFRSKVACTHNIAPIHRVEVDEEETMLVMPYYAGGDLSALLAGKRPTQSMVAAYTKQVRIWCRFFTLLWLPYLRFLFFLTFAFVHYARLVRAKPGIFGGSGEEVRA